MIAMRLLALLREPIGKQMRPGMKIPLLTATGACKSRIAPTATLIGREGVVWPTFADRPP
jgi:hypothetical protein